MSTITTDMRETLDWMTARRIRYEPTGTLQATNMQNAIEELQADVVAAISAPPALVATQVNFAMSPYTVQPTDYLLEVDTSGGAITIQTQASAFRGNRGFDVKDVTGNAGANNISVVRAGAELIDGLATYLIASPYGANHFQPRAAGYEVI